MTPDNGRTASNAGHPAMKWLLRGALIAVTAVLYGTYLDRSPIYLNNDEAAFALQAHTLATTGHDTNGRWLPLYFQIYENVWYHPAIVYAMTVVLAVLPLAEWAVRLPTVAMAIVNVLLVHALASRLTRHEPTAVLTAALLIFTPAHFMHARLACDYLFPVPFVLTWMLCLFRFRDTGRTVWLLAGVSALGIGIYTYIASVVMMPLYVLVTLYWVVRVDGRFGPRAAWAVAGFVPWLVPLAGWLLAHPEMYVGLASRYQRFNVDVVGDPTGALSSDAVLSRAEVYARFFDPWFLFSVAESNVMSSTYQTGVFLKATGVLVSLGLIAALLRRGAREWRLVIVVLLTAPVAASLVTEAYAIDRALMLLPAVVLLAGNGLHILFTRAGRIGVMLAIALLAWMPWQFDGFYRDYLGDYRARSAFWFNGNNRGAMRDLMDNAAPESDHLVYIAENIPFARIYWELYTRMFDREDLLARTVYFNSSTPIDAIAAGSSLLTNFGDPIERELLKRTDVRPVQFTMEPSGSRTFVRFEKIAVIPAPPEPKAE